MAWPKPIGGPGLLPTPAIPPVRAIAATPLQQIPIHTKPLSKEEMKSKREKRICYFCDDKYAPGHDCRRRLYHLTALDDEDPLLTEDWDVAVDDSPQGGQDDYGSTHNFVKETVAHMLNWPIIPTNSFRVIIGNGESLLYNKKCVDVKFTLQSHEFSVDLFILPIKGAGVVLGVQWLAELGPILMNYKISTMEFQWKGKPIKLVGEAALNPHPLKASHLKGLTKSNAIASYFTLLCVDETHAKYYEHLFIVELRHFVSVFFDDILVYSRAFEDHIQHLTSVLHCLSSNNLYYRRFVQHYATVAFPLTQLLKKDAFKWSSEAQSAFDRLKVLMTQVLVLALPDFSQDFVLETDASSIAIGAVLMQQCHPIAYFSKKMSPSMSVASTYVKELFAITEAVKKWRQLQLHDFYKAGNENRAADALSRVEEVSSLQFPPTASSAMQLQTTISGHVFDISSQLQLENATGPELLEIQSQSQKGVATSAFTLQNGLIFHNNKLFISSTLPVPKRIWEDVAMDYITGLPLLNGFTTILVIIDRLLKYAHLGALPMTYNAVKVAKLFIDMVFKLHGSSPIEAADTELIQRDALLAKFVLHLSQAQSRMKYMADKKRLDREFEVGSWVLLKLQPYRQQTLSLEIELYSKETSQLNRYSFSGKDFFQKIRHGKNLEDIQLEFPNLNLEDKVNFDGVGSDRISDVQISNEYNQQPVMEEEIAKGNKEVLVESLETEGQSKGKRIKCKPVWMKDYIED
ncbi:uncharacterized protein LOC143863335 [Tasmannia lanceolata]|uniref:uncharacterized protein LOC143863335 n=1 Tax=Tasmannia lanceolata TaxID=3420 RepID=UPI004062870B